MRTARREIPVVRSTCCIIESMVAVSEMWREFGSRG